MNDRKIKFPTLGDVFSVQSYVIVGANGSGKSHLGAWIENNKGTIYVMATKKR